MAIPNYPLTTGAVVLGLVAGPDGNIWASGYVGSQGYVWVVSRLTGAILATYTPATYTQFSGILSDGSNLWAAAYGTTPSFAKITTGGAFTFYSAPGVGGDGSQTQTMCFDGTLVWAVYGSNQLVSCTSGGVVTTYTNGASPQLNTLFYAHGYKWSDNANINVVQILTNTTNSQFAPPIVGTGPVYYADDGTNLWYAQLGGAGLTSFNPSTPGVQTAYTSAPAGQTAKSVVYHGGLLWVGNSVNLSTSSIIYSVSTSAAGTVITSYGLGVSAIIASICIDADGFVWGGDLSTLHTGLWTNRAANAAIVMIV